jgi:hypothetical protein
MAIPIYRRPLGAEPARIAFETTRGDFGARFAAAIEAQIVPLAKPEVVIDIPDRPEDLTKRELEDLVRPAEVGFLKSYPAKLTCSSISS